MYRIGVVLAGLAVGLLLVGEGQSGDKGTKKVKLPQNWSKLGLSADQLKMIQTIKTSYGGKIAELTDKLDKLKKKEREEMFNVLTDSQRDNLRRILLEKAGGPAKDKEKTPTKDKKGG